MCQLGKRLNEWGNGDAAARQSSGEIDANTNPSRQRAPGEIRRRRFSQLSQVSWRGQAQAQSVKIVGISAATCQDFLAEVKGRADVEKNFFGWAQGMSGLLIRAPAGKDEDLDLTPPAFPLLKQAEFLRPFCSKNRGADFSDGNELYRTLRPRLGNLYATSSDPTRKQIP